MWSLFTILLTFYTLRPADSLPQKGPQGSCKPLRMQSPPGEPIALVSFPGSGSTWLRYLLQQATGLCTGSVHYDEDLRLNGYPCENITDGSVLVVKTHEMKLNNFKSAILLIRLPEDAILAEFNKLFAGHLGTAPLSVFHLNLHADKMKGEDIYSSYWDSFVFAYLTAWEIRHQEWLLNFKGPMHIAFYEDLVENTQRALTDILKFLNYKFTESDVSCAVAHRESNYHRSRKLHDFNPYTEGICTKVTAVRKRIDALVNLRLHDKRYPTHRFE